MDKFLNYFILLIISYLGLAVGGFISFFSKEELKIGKKYFNILRPTIFSIGFYYLLYSLNLGTKISALFFVLVFLISFVLIKWKFIYMDFLIYGFFSIAFHEAYSAIISIIIFVFGVITSSYYFQEKISLLHNIRKQLIKNLVFILFGIILYLV